MANRMKEDEKNERIIRGLLKLPANRRCINCNSLGPQYVCTNFWTFICTTCSGIHREFTHRVKSVSMAKFTSQEVSALQGGGNERAKEVFFKEWDPQRHYVPDSSNVERLRDFIKHVYVDKRYTGERSVDRPPRVKMGEKEDSADSRRADVPRGGSRSPPYEESYDRRHNDRNYKSGYEERRSPGYDQDYRRSPVRFEVVDDRRFREDRFGNGPQNRKFEDRKFPDEVSSSESRSPNYQKEVEASSPPVVRPVREILGESVPPLRIGEPPKANGGRSADGLLRAQRTASSGSLGSVEGAELKRANSGSLIDFNADPQPGPVTAPAQTDLFSSQPVQQQPAVRPTGGDNWASFGFDSQEVAHTTSLNSNSLESQLAQLSSAVAIPTNQKQSSALPVAGGTLESALSQLTAPVATTTPGGVDTFAKTDGSQWSSTNHVQPSPSLVGSSQGISPQLPFHSGMANNQLWASSLQPNSQGPSALPHNQSSQAMTTQLPYPGVVAVSRPQQSEVKPAPFEAASTGRQALPEDLFTASFVPRPVPIQHWQRAPPYAFGYGMQYTSAMLQPMPNFTQSSKSANPFDVNSEPSVGHTPSFPSMTPLQTALPRMPVPAPLLRTSSFGTPQQWVPQSSSYLSAVPPGPYMVQHASNTMVPLGGNERSISGNFGNEGTAFGALSAGQQPGLGYSQQEATPHTFPSSGGNPFS